MNATLAIRWQMRGRPPSVTPPAFLTARADFCPKSNPIQCSENAIRAIIRTSTSEGYERIYDGSTGPDAHDARAGRIPGASSLTRCAGGYGWVVSQSASWHTPWFAICLPHIGAASKRNKPVSPKRDGFNIGRSEAFRTVSECADDAELPGRQGRAGRSRREPGPR